MIPNFTKKLLVLSALLLGLAGFSQEYNNFDVRYQNNIKGDLTFISNQIVNRFDAVNGVVPEDPYNNLNNNGSFWPASNRNFETGGRYNYNDYKDMRYINADPEPGIFNSSTTTFNFPNPDCNLIRYAGLYWSATYPRDNTTDPVGTPRTRPINQVKFKVPGGAYVDITADEVLFDGLTNPALAANAPYAAYADVTNILTALPNATGDYTVGNIAVAQGVGYDLATGTSHMTGGSAGGWTLVIVYENPNLTGKLITTFDGFARVRNTDQVNIPYNGFTTIPVGQVNANIGAAALEGDFRITGDRMRIRAASNGGFTTMSNGSNPANNFFNSNITLNAVDLPGRNPSSANTLGFDTDIFTLNNFANSVIPNNETAATFRFQTNGDQYYPFFNSFNIEIIEPDIVLEKRVEDIAGNDITGLGVNLGQTLDYVLSFQNLGNDHGTNYTIRDVLPINVTLDETNYVLPPGMSPPTYDPATRTVVFTVPDALVQVGDPVSSIRMRVRVAENCFDFIDACTDLIQNVAYSTYQGVINDNQITDDPSVTDFNNCGFIIPGATNFLLDDLENCNYTRTVQLCGNDVLLDAGDNFDTYVWVSDDNGNGLYDATDTVLQSGTSDTFLVSTEGTYIVDKIVADPCKGFKEIFVVERFGSNTVNPILNYFNTVNADADVTNDIEGEITTCSIDGDLLTKIFLCGTGDAQLLETNITDAQTISWELLDESSCTAAPDDCANKNATCTWNQVATGGSHTVNSAGKYRLVVTYQNGCFNRFYFDVFQNNLTIDYDIRDIICTTDGYINITNIGSGYGFQLIDITNNNILVPFSANNGPNFPINTNGQYRVDVVPLDGSGNPIPNACVFSTPDIGIRDRNFQVDITTTPVNCNAQGTIQVDILNVEPNYTYILRQSDGTLIDDETAQPDNTFTFNVTEGDYIIEVATDDGCTMTQNVTVARTPDPTVSAILTQDIGCSAGTITVNATGGFPNPDYGFAIWSKDGANLYATVGDIPGSAYQVETAFTFGWRDTDNDSIDEYFPGEDGTYVFIVVDANGCSALSNPVTITDNGAMTVAVNEDSLVSCSGSNDASITLVPTGGVGPFTYSIDGGTTTQTTPTFVGLSAGTYPISVTDSSGCTIAFEHIIAEPFPLSASAGVSRDATCDPMGGEVRVTNVVGGNAPYQYSFDGGGTFGATSTAVLAPGTYTVVVRDATGCEFPMMVTVDDTPPPPGVTLTPEVSYNCDGSAIVTATPSNPGYNYTYELDGVLNSPDPTSNVFSNVPPGTYTVRTNYTNATPPAPSLLLSEDFGFGNGTIPSPNTIGYNYEDQTNNPPGDTNNRINDFEYSVTNNIVAPYGPWVNPNDHTNPSNSNGRFLVINVGTPSPGQIIYSKDINDIIPNRPLTVSLYIFNLLTSTNGQLDPDLTIEIRETATSNIVASIRTGDIPKNTGPNDWREFTASLNPGANTSLEFVIRSEKVGNSGNDFAIDDISIFQQPEVCPLFVETPVTVVAGRIFGANGINSTNVSCNGLTDGTITFEVENFDATAGFDYSLDGGTTYVNSTTSPVTTPAIWGAGSHTILLRKADVPACTATLTTTITEPDAVVASASITTPISCTNGGATITASATGGLPTYEYQLEDTVGGVITAYQTGTTFTSIAPGDYIVRVRDNNLCEDPIDVALTVAPTNAIAFDTVPTACYSGANDASIQVNVTDGNGDYTFSINGGPWVTPTPANATTHTFINLANGDYTINVSDGSGCIGIVQNVTINPELTVSATAPNITACATSTDITITGSGGDANYVYAVVPNGNAVVDGDFSTTNPVAVTAAGDYDVHIRDNGGASGYCSDVFTITIVQDAPIAITPTPTAVSCFGGTDGAINIIVDSGGFGPFEYSIDSGTTYQVGASFVNLVAGTYPVQVRDANGCETVPVDVIVAEPAQLIAEAVQTQDYTCLQLGQITVGSVTPTSGGSGNYQYSINGGTWTASTTGGHTFVDLLDGTYGIRVRDANAISCETTLADVIIAPLPVEPTLSSAISYNCDGTGDITITPFDATYTYILDGVLPGQTGAGANVLADVAVGPHIVTVNYGSDCTVDIPVVIEPGNAFEASITAFENLDCNADNSGTITISANNFGAGGFEYSLNSGAFVGPFTADQQITGLAAQAHSIVVRDVDDPIAGCTVTLNQTLTEPTVIVASASITEAFTCDNTGATITASATGGTPTYEYQLEDGVGGIITAYQTPVTFTNLAAGDYIVRARDINGCDDPIDTAITVVAPVNPTFTATPTACYSGTNDASILVDVTSVPGNGGFQFSINAGPWITPTPATDTTYTFDNLANGTYTIDVRDAFGCQAPQQTITIEPQLTAIVDVADITCNDGTITVTPSGGDGNYAYAFVTAGTGVTVGDFAALNTFTVTAGNEGNYDVYVWDNNAGTPHCEYMETVTVDPATPIAFTATANDPECHDGVGSIDVTITSGDIPYQIRIVDLDNAGASNQTVTNILGTTQSFYNLLTGEYEVYVEDTNGCETQLSPNITINNPDELIGSVVGVTPSSCTGNPADFGFEFTAYSTTLGTVEFSTDGGTTWVGDNSNPGVSDRFTGYNSGDIVFPSMRTVDLGGNTVCQTDLPQFVIPYPLDDLDITVTAVVVNCNELRVTVQGAEGTPNYQYTYSEDAANFNPVAPTNPWTTPPTGLSNPHTFTGLVPGREYVFYVRDSSGPPGCVRQSNVNVNDLITVPLEITTAYEPSCSGANDGTITYTITDNIAPFGTEFRWDVFDITSGSPVSVASSGGNQPYSSPQNVTVSGLAPGNYHIVVTEVNGGVDGCVGASENLLLEELNPITATLNKLSDISCNTPGLISVDNIQGGGGTFNFTVTGPVGFTTITTTTDNPISIPANSPAGNYNVRVTDQFGCFEDFGPINLDLTPNPTIDSMVVDNCASPTSLAINATSTASQILYSIDGGTNYVDNGGVFNNLSSGIYNIAIIDSNGCTDTDTVEVFPVLEATVSLTKLIDCTVSPDAEITIDVTVGSTNYDYEITNGLGSVVTRAALPTNPFVFTTAVPEDYTITIYDNGTSAPECNRVFNITVPAAVIPAFTEVHTDVTCNTADDGTITVSTVDNGIGPYTFRIIAGNGSSPGTPILPTSNTSTSATFTGLVGTVAGITYTIEARGANNCDVTVDQIITQPDAIANVNANVVEFGCATGNNTDNATITIDDAAITGGSGNYVRYEFINNQGTPATGDDVIVQDGSGVAYTETDIAGGTYIINVYDDMGCIGTTTTTILPYVEITNPTVTITQDVTCNPGNDAEVVIGIVINPSAGATNLEYSVIGTDNAYSVLNQASNAFTALGIGNYQVTVENTLTGCSVQTTFEIEDPNTFEIATTVVDVVCFGDDGSVSFTIFDAINPYVGGFTWQIYESQGTDDLLDDIIVAGAAGVSANLGPTAPFAIGAGEYRVEITQDSDPSCVNNERFVIAGPSATITANVDVTPITCAGNDGVIEIIDVLGGWGDYSYYVGTVAPTVVGDYVATPRFDSLAPGTYQAWVIDRNGCQRAVQSAIVLADPTPITATLQLNQPNCPNFSGEIAVIGTTGGQNIPGNYTYQLIKDGTPVGAPQNTTVFSGLDVGSYTVQIDDQWSCTFTTLAEILYEPIVPLATVVKTIDCTVDPGGHITITQTGGSGNFDYEVRYPGTLATDPADATNTTGVFTTLTLVGDYVFTITDQAVGHACPVIITQNLQDVVLPVLTIDAFTDVICNAANDGTITVSTVDNGVGPYTFRIIAGNGSSPGTPILPTSNTSTSATFTGLVGTVAGITYTIEARGTNNCDITVDQIITQPDAIANVNANVVEFGCATGNNTDNATITIDDAAITGGSGNYVRYEFINTDTATTVQDGANPSYTETNFQGGNYSINVYDDIGCIGNTTVVIAPFTGISDPTVTVTQDITCNPAILEEIQVGVTITPAAGAVNLEYTATGTNVVYNQTNASGAFTGMGIGNYAISITNLTTGCVVQTTHEILDPDVIRAIATKLTDEECLNNGVDEGSFEIAINNYTGNYSYQLYDNSDNPVVGAGFSGTGNTATPLIISNLPGGVYYVRIIETDAPFCQDDSNAITIIAPEFPVSATVSEQASPSCTDDQGSLLVDPEGGVGPYTIVLTNTTTTQTYTETNVEAFIFSGLSSGDFDISVTDAQGCPITDTVTLLRPDNFTPTISSTPIVCFNGNTGTVFTTVPSGRNVDATATYLYRLNTYDQTGTNILVTSAPQSTVTFSGLSAGFYSITTSDGFGCEFTSPIEQILNPTEVVAQLIRTSPLTCATGVELELSATGGSGTYEYSEDNVTWISMTGSSAAIPNASIPGPLGSGTYRYYVRDAANGCTSVLSNEISEDDIMPLAFTEVNATIIACVGDTATITADATGGLGNYMYELYTDVSLSAASRIAGPQSSGIFNNLTSGTYYVNVLSEDCTTPAEQVIIAEPTPLDYTEDVINALCFGDENGSITVTLSGGAGGYQYAISPNLNQFDTENTFDGLAPGDYTVIAQDQNGCFIQLDYTITAPELLTATAVATPEVCAGDQDGTITLTIQGGTAPYSTRLSDEANFVQDRTDLTSLSAGGYIIFVRDANGCMTDLGITIEPGANLNATVEPVYECTGDTPDNYVNITLEDQTTIGDVLYALDSTDPADMQLNPDFRNTAPGSHYIAIAHANGCIRTIDFEIEDFEPLTLSLEQGGINTITATATGGLEDYTFYFDGVNNGVDNTYIINRTDTFIVRVVDANGCEVTANIDMEFIDIEIPNFFTPDGDGLNDVWMPLNQEAFPEILTIIFDRYGREVYRMTLNTPGWDGLYKQSELPTGDYWYVIKLRGENDDREFVGHFTLYR